MSNNIIKSSSIKSGDQKVKLSQQGDKKRPNLKRKDSKDELDKEQNIAKKKKAEIIQEAREKAEDMISQAEKDAAVLKRKAKLKAEKEFEEKLAEVKEEAYQEGFKEGLAEGEKQGYQESLAKTEKLIEQLEEAVEQFRADLETRLPELKDQLSVLVIKISEKIIGHQLQEEPELIKTIIQKSLAEISSEENVKIKVKPSDLELLADYKEELLKKNNFLSNVKIVADDSIKVGGCVIETDYGGVDATITSQLEEVYEKVLRGNNDGA